MIDDNVKHPSHYTDGKIEVIEFIEDKQLSYHRGNAIKYICRAGKKDASKEIEDLQGETLVSEGIDSNYMDIINYAVFGVIKINEQQQ